MEPTIKKYKYDFSFIKQKLYKNGSYNKWNSFIFRIYQYLQTHKLNRK